MKEWKRPQIDYTVHPDHWIWALYDLEDRGDKKPLCDLLRTCELSAEVGGYLADLIERRLPPKSRGRPRTPAYVVPEVIISHELVLRAVAKYRKMGMSEEDAIEKAATENDLAVTVATVTPIRGKRGL
jgi:hypothetical protein